MEQYSGEELKQLKAVLRKYSVPQLKNIVRNSKLFLPTAVDESSKELLIKMIITNQMDFYNISPTLKPKKEPSESKQELKRLKEIITKYFKKQKRKISLRGLSKSVLIDLIDTIINKKPEEQFSQ